MSTLAAKFKAMQKAQKKEVDREAIQLMTLKELEDEKIMFGEAKKGLTYAEAFKDTTWVEFILSRFENSGKSDHMMFIRYVELRMAEMAKEESHTSLKKKESSSKGSEEIKGNTKSMPPIPQDVWEELQEVPMMEPGVILMPQVQEEMQDLRQANQNLHNRVGHVEMMVQEVLEHMRKLIVKQEN